MEVATGEPKKVMVIADPTRESAGAVQWAISHAVLEDDELFLLHVEQPNSWRNTISTFLRKPSSQVFAATTNSSMEGGGGGGGDIDFLDVMKNVCETAQPKVRVHIDRVEIDGKDKDKDKDKAKASIILLKCRMLSINLLVIGQRRHSILGRRLNGGSTRAIDTAEYLIENSKCTCIGVQKKGQNAGYLLNTKKQRNFWLLA